VGALTCSAEWSQFWSEPLNPGKYCTLAFQNLMVNSGMGRVSLIFLSRVWLVIATRADVFKNVHQPMQLPRVDALTKTLLLTCKIDQ